MTIKKLNKNDQVDIKTITRLYNIGFNNTKWVDSDIIKILEYRDIWYLLYHNNKIVGLLNGKTFTTRDDKYISKYITNKTTLIISDLISTVSGGGTMLLTILNDYKLDIFLTMKHRGLISFYRKCGFVKVPKQETGDKRLCMVKYLSKSEERLKREKRIILIKGNPEHSVSKKITKKFYNDIADIVKYAYNLKVELLESGVKHAEHCEQLEYGDIVIGFSRGGTYAKIWKKFCDSKAYFIGIGCPDYTDNDILITNEKDKTAFGDMGETSLIAHWTMSSDMSYDLRRHLDKYKKKTNI